MVELSTQKQFEWNDTVVKIVNTVTKQPVLIFESAKQAANTLCVATTSVQHSYGRKRVVKGKIKSDKIYSDLYPGQPLVARLIRRTPEMVFVRGQLKMAA